MSKKKWLCTEMLRKAAFSFCADARLSARNQDGALFRSSRIFGHEKPP
jgi:hypothetical protein